MMLKNIAYYYLLIVLPLAAIALLLWTGAIGATFFAVAMTYLRTVYHPVVSGLQVTSRRENKTVRIHV